MGSTTLTKNIFETVLNGKQVHLYFLENEFLRIAITNYGATIVSIIPKVKNVTNGSIVAGFSTIEEYIKANSNYYGATIGRYANRIANGKFTLNNTTYLLSVNNEPNTLHGGLNGFSMQVWDVISSNEEQIVLQYFSPDGEEGFPGAVTTNVSYTLQADKLIIDYDASTTAQTYISLTNHAYFNMNGFGTGNVLQHKLYINANQYVPIDNNFIPLPNSAIVTNTPFDFTKSKTIEEQLDYTNQQIIIAKGFDHSFVLTKEQDELSLAATLIGNKTGIHLTVYTTKPCLQLYTGNFMQGNNTFIGGFPDAFQNALCLETQYYPNSPNRPNAEATIVLHDNPYHHQTIYQIN